MWNKTIFYLILLFVIGSCNVSTNEQQNLNSQKLAARTSEKLEAQYSNKKSLAISDNKGTHNLDSTKLEKWTDKYVPFKYDNQRLYSANLYSIQPSSTSYKIISVHSNADHWNKIHLISLTENLELIDHIEIAESFSDLVDQTEDTEIVQHYNEYSEMISNNEYLKYSINKKEIIDYNKDTTTYEIDSITHRITINNDGRFILTKLDSARKDYTP